MLTAVVVLPSEGWLEVTSTVLGGWPADDVRALAGLLERFAAAAAEVGPAAPGEVSGQSGQ